MPGIESLGQLLAIAGAGLLAGSTNAVAGGGSALTFPVLVMTGIPPVAANATSATGLVPGSAAAALSYRGELRRARPATLWLAVPSVIGGVLGAWLLVTLPPTWFAALAPWLVMGAALSVLLEPTARRWLQGASTGGTRPTERGRAAGGDPHHGRTVGATGRGRVAGTAAWFATAVYGGYFGAGMGMLLLTTLGLLGVHDLQHANGLKNLLSVAIKIPALIWFIVLGLPVWPAVLALLAGSILGGWAAGHLVQKIDPSRLRWLVATVGTAMGLFMLVR